MDSLAAIEGTDSANAVGSWALTLVLVAAVLESLRTGDLLWAGFVLVCVAVVVLPPLAYRNWHVTVPWPHLLVVTGAVVVRALEFYGEVAGFLALAALATVVVVELATFTEVELTPRFAVVFGVLTTLALQGWWTIAQYYVDRLLGTGFLFTQRELQVDFVAVAVVAFVLGVVSEWYLATATDEDVAGPVLG